MPSTSTIRYPTFTAYALSCALEGKEYYRGNYVRYSKRKFGSNSVLEILWDYYKYCEPIPAACHCEAIIEKLLVQHSDVHEIFFDSFINPDGFMNNCECYLRSAAMEGFKFVQIAKDLTGHDCCCQEKVEFSKDTSSKLCEIMKKNGCRNKFARITKS